MRNHRRLLALLLCLAGLAVVVVPASATAKSNVAIAIADENASMFNSPVYQALQMKRTRYFIPWNAIADPQALVPAVQFVNAARAHGVSVLMHISTDTFTHGVASLPSVAAYAKNVKALIKLFKPLGVKEWGVWNEENHISEPTYRSPKRAAQFFLAMRKICNGCTIVALDLLDAKSATGYIKSFYKALKPADRAKAKLIGIHNYEDVNHKRTSGTQGVIDAVRAQNRRAQFWVTETGGIVSLPPKFPCDETRAAKATSYMFTLAKKFSRYVKRLYYYSWSTAANCGNFDAGLTRANGAPRPAYTTFAQALPGFTR